MNMTERTGVIALIAAFSLLLFIELPGSALIEPDEARYAEIPREMLAAGDLVTPRLNGTKYYEKPPLLYWANAASFKLLGETPFAARLPARLSALGTAALIAWSLGGEWGLWAALILLSAPLSFVLGRYNVTDGVLTFAMTLTLVAMRSFFQRRDRGESAIWALAALGLGAGLAVLAKGLIGIVLPGLVFLLWVGIVGEWKRLWELILSPAPVVLFAVAAPWFIMMERANPGFSQVFFIREHFQRFATNEAKREGPIYYFVLAFIGGFLPWTFAFGAWLASARVKTREALKERRDELLFALWFFVILAFFSVSKSKLLPYILPALPAAATLTAHRILGAPIRLRVALTVYALLFTTALIVGIVFVWPFLGLMISGEALVAPISGLAALIIGAWTAVRISADGRRSALLAATAGWGGLYLALVVALPAFSHDLATDDLARYAASVPGATVVAYKNYPQGFAWTLGHPIVVADFTGELATDGNRPSELFWSNEEFWKRWKSGEPLAVVLRRRALADWSTAGEPTPTALAFNGTYLVVTNVRPVPTAGRP